MSPSSDAVSASPHCRVGPLLVAAVLCLFRQRVSSSVRASIRTIRSRANRSRRMPRSFRSCPRSDLYEMFYNLFVTAGYTPTGSRAKNINTIDEVPDSSWFTNRIGTSHGHRRRDYARSDVGPPPDPSSWILIREKTAGAHPGFTARDAAATPSFSSSIRRIFRREPPGRWQSRPRSSGRSATTRSSRYLTTFDPKRVYDRSDGHAAPSLRRPDPVHHRRHELDPRARGEESRRDLPRHRRTVDSWQDSRRASVTTAPVPTTPTTSFRTSIAANYAPCACSGPGPT